MNVAINAVTSFRTYLHNSRFYPKYDTYLVLNTNFFKQQISKSFT